MPQLTGQEAAMTFMRGFSSGAMSTAFKVFFPDVQGEVASGMIAAFRSAAEDLWKNVFADNPKPWNDIAVDAIISGFTSFVLNSLASGVVEESKLKAARKLIADKPDMAEEAFKKVMYSAMAVLGNAGLKSLNEILEEIVN